MLIVVTELKELSSVVKVRRIEEACKGGPNKQLLKESGLLHSLLSGGRSVHGSEINSVG